MTACKHSINLAKSSRCISIMVLSKLLCDTRALVISAAFVNNVPNVFELKSPLCNEPVVPTTQKELFFSLSALITNGLEAFPASFNESNKNCANRVNERGCANIVKSGEFEIQEYLKNPEVTSARLLIIEVP